MNECHEELCAMLFVLQLLALVTTRPDTLHTYTHIHIHSTSVYTHTNNADRESLWVSVDAYSLANDNNC